MNSEAGHRVNPHLAGRISLSVASLGLLNILQDLLTVREIPLSHFVKALRPVVR